MLKNSISLVHVMEKMNISSYPIPIETVDRAAAIALQEDVKRRDVELLRVDGLYKNNASVRVIGGHGERNVDGKISGFSKTHYTVSVNYYPKDERNLPSGRRGVPVTVTVSIRDFLAWQDERGGDDYFIAAKSPEE